MGVVGLWGLLIGSFAILSASVFSQSSLPEYSAVGESASVVVLEAERLNEEPTQLKGKLEDVEVSVGAENATLKWTMEVTTKNISTASVVNAPAWELGGQTEFNVSQAMGGWQWIEVFEKDYPRSCEEFFFNLRGSTVKRTWRWGKADRKSEGKNDFTVDTQSPHQWTSEGGWVWTWLTTDYANWAVLLRYYIEEYPSNWSLYILSRERTLPHATLEMLRNVAEQRGFSKANGVLVDQTSC